MSKKTDWKTLAEQLADGTNLSWREIAKALGVARSTVSDHLRQHCARKNVVEELVKEAVLDTSRILVISDMHIPYHHNKMLPFLGALKAKYSPTVVISVGDEADKAGLSYHEKHPSMMSAADELQLTRMYIKEVEKLFPQMTILHSNHGSLAFRKSASAGIPAEYLKSCNDVYGVGEGWKWIDSLILPLPDGSPVYFTHGRNKDVTKVAKGANMCAVQGHHHSLSKVEWWKPFTVKGVEQKPLWAMQVGCLLDDYSRAFNYNKADLTSPLINCGVIVNGKPEIVFLEELV